MSETIVAVRRCAACGTTKAVDEFPPRKDRPSGRMSRCHECDRKRSAIYYASVRRAALGHTGFRTGFSLTYRAVHKRIQTARGKASSHQCAHCSDQAAHWAYDHADPYPMTGLVRYRDKETLCLYSTDPARYLPLCRPCHARFDAGR